MILVLTQVLVAAALLLTVVALGYALFDRVIGNVVLGLAALVELGVIVQLVRGLAGIPSLDGSKATFTAYLITLPFVLAITVWSAIKDKTRWAMASIGIGAFAVAVMTLRLQQIWDLHG
ncbi:hypothetical protein N802_06665 [Knoellia sinensis KCTC 19936]|uniref:Integral membrane protein n=1 Tax=Knoellia sinensis KCTC 19936 TaxID=1385520 RepID=A0A0A0J2Z7_9MICO|nr:hypothetical protein [Knoellia sinensis]KGN30492.1 hypothetical protein N802_06665 [Knoellia sinensis KCTC 19936]